MRKLKIKIKNSRVLKISLLLVFFTCYTLYAIRYTLLFAQDKIIAIVNKDIITQRDLDDFISFMRVQLSTEYKGEQLEREIQSMKLDLLDKLIEDRLILQEAKKDNIQIDPARVKARIDEIKKHYGSDIEFQKDLGKRGLVQADIEAKIREQILMYSIVDKKIRSKIIINPGEVTDFYEANIKEFILPEQREFASITVDDESQAFEVFEKLNSGQGLEEIANRYSLSLNKFSSARDGQLRKDIEEIVFKMNVGQISAPLKIEDNYYIFKLNNIIHPRQQNLSEVQNEIHTMLFNRKMTEALAQWLDELKTRSYIKIIQD